MQLGIYALSSEQAKSPSADSTRAKFRFHHHADFLEERGGQNAASTDDNRLVRKLDICLFKVYPHRIFLYALDL